MRNTNSWFRGTAIAGLALSLPWTLLLSITSPPTAAAPMPPPQSAQDWQATAGGKMAFESASLAQNLTEFPGRVFFNLPIGPGDVYTPTGGLFRVRNLPLANLIIFAYKITPNQEQFLISQLPQWAITYRYDVDAKAEGNPTKDQMRLMVQSLLADRFKLAIHYESRQIPILAVVQVDSGQFGPLLQRHPEDSPCPTSTAAPSPSPEAQPQTVSIDTRFPRICGGIVGMPPSAPDRVRSGARNVPMDLIVNSIEPEDTGSDRPVVNQTGLTGGFDFAIEFVPGRPAPAEPSSGSKPTGPTFLEALKEQLGLKLVPQTGSLEVPVIDFIQELLPN